jgi:hypothetical protein
MPHAFIQVMSFFTSAITSGPMPSPARRRSLYVAIWCLVAGADAGIAKGRSMSLQDARAAAIRTNASARSGHEIALNRRDRQNMLASD